MGRCPNLKRQSGTRDWGYLWGGDEVVGGHAIFKLEKEGDQKSFCPKNMY